MSPDSAVRIIATSDLMVDRSIKRWLRQHYPGWDAEPHEFTEIGMDRYAVVYISTSNQPSRRVYFRIAKSPNDDMESGIPRALNRLAPRSASAPLCQHSLIVVPRREVHTPRRFTCLPVT